ncbi:MAG TPA: hypothetical protein VHW23_42630 [Kofleriaceae bacterium]|nr:hypothetical protein [Kofleriaceae bacterium]
MTPSLAFTALAIAALAGCGASPAAVKSPATDASAQKIPEPPTKPAPRAPDPDLHRPPRRKLLDIDWAKVALTDDAAAVAVWRRIAPTGADWDDKLQEVPAQAARPLALAMLHGGQFLCTPPPTGDCPRPTYDVDTPAETAGVDDPCLRRLLALWSLDQLEDGDLPAIQDALLQIAKLPPPESQLVEAAIRAVPETDQDTRLAIAAAAWRAGQRDLAGGALSGLDEVHLVAAAHDHHMDPALDILAADGQRTLFLAAVNDEALGPRARTAAIGELVALVAASGASKLPPDLAAALATATRAKDCSVAAAAARALAQHGDPRFVPRRPRTAATPQLMRAVCVLASYEALLGNDEPSLVPGYVPARGLERMTITYDPLSEDDPDGDGDPHTSHTAELVPRTEAVLPELEDLVRAMQHCTGTICVSDDHEFRFVWQRIGGEMLLSRIELADRPPCTPAAAGPAAKP